MVADRGEVLVRYAYLFTGDVPAAQDLLQDALVKVFARTRTGFEPDVLEAYVRRTIATLYIDWHRRRRRWADVQHLFLLEDTGQAHERGTTASLDLRAALAGLGRQERTAVVLRFFEDLTVPEVANVMGLAEGSVKRYLSNAMRRLEQRLGPVATQDDGEVVTTTTQRAGRRG
ncbi:sigma-70 family RNA polymerase sigma factor [Actinotalea ferrariae]|uniref:sigma-70 family RNA polymerase sigma factor n=1 Tax=Actinotalea ferrariae TaxID=1386098 RepID=UPI0021AB5B98|nr:sigma-70 family RNA polymerase sigma factor [Actinotalea ferrariae]